MSEAISALSGVAYDDGVVSVSEAPLQGMITLRGEVSSKAFKAAVMAVLGVAVPKSRAVVSKGDHAVAWMSPDELLVFVAYDKAAALAADLTTALADEHSLAANVSDARALFVLRGAQCREVIAKLAPVDMSPGHFGSGQMRRTRFGQIAAAFWLVSDEEAHIICFRSVAQYMFDQLAASATPGQPLNLWS